MRQQDNMNRSKPTYQELEKIIAQLEAEKKAGYGSKDCQEPSPTELLLKEKEEQFRTIFTSSPQPMALSEAESGKLIEVNEVFCEKVGASKDQLLGFTTTELGFYSKKDRKVFTDELLQNGAVDGLEMTFTTPRQENFIAKMFARFIRVNNQQYVLTIFDDVTKEKKAEQRLRESEEKFRSFVENANDIIYQLSPEGIFTYVSPNWESILGHPVNEVLGQHFSSFVHPDDINVCIDFLQKIITTGLKQRDVEYRVKHQDGRWKWHTSNASPLKNAAGKVIAYIGVARDITKRKNDEIALKEANEEYAALNEELKSINERLQTEIQERQKAENRLKNRLRYEHSINTCSTVLLNNEPNAADEGLRYVLDSSEASCIHIFKNYEAENGDLCIEQIHGVCAGHSLPTKVKLSKEQFSYQKDGLARWKIALSKHKIISGKVSDLPAEEQRWLKARNIQNVLVIPLWVKNVFYGFIEFDYILAEKTWNENDLAQLRTLAELYGIYFQNKANEQTIVQHNQKLKALNATKDKLFSIIGHDLKNPISNIQGFSALIKNNHSSYSEDKIRYFNEMIYQSTEYLSGLLDDLLTWSRTQRRKIPYHPEFVYMHSLVNETINLLKLSADKKQIRLINQIDKEQKVYADRPTTTTIIRNLLSNAIKFTHPGGKIAVWAEKETENLITGISDTGVGIEKDKLESIFQMGDKASATGTSGEQGTGLGLILCKEFIELNKGSIWAESQPGKGSTFYFSLPVKEPGNHLSHSQT